MTFRHTHHLHGHRLVFAKRQAALTPLTMYPKPGAWPPQEDWGIFQAEPLGPQTPDHPESLFFSGNLNSALIPSPVLFLCHRPFFDSLVNPVEPFSR